MQSFYYHIITTQVCVYIICYISYLEAQPHVHYEGFGVADCQCSEIPNNEREIKLINHVTAVRSNNTYFAMFDDPTSMSSSK
jgi:hypothetical protein